VSRTIQLALLTVLLAGLLASAKADDPFHLKPGAKGKLCLECHLTVQDELKMPFVHTPVAAGNCSDCHNPHASTHGQLLEEDVTKICTTCHEAMVRDDTVSAHRFVIEGNCVTCHSPHASQHKNGLAEAGRALCLGCHEEMGAKLASNRFGHPPVEDSCLSCHDPHSSSQADFLLIKNTGELCGECHDTSATSFVDRHMGYPVGGSRCTSCHDPHGSNTSGIMLAEVHKPLTNRMCNQCHMEPGSPNALAVKSSGVSLCRGCHMKVINETRTSDRVHWPVVDEAACLNCHSPHASDEGSLLLASTKSLCGGCHPDTIAREEASLTKHAPVEEGNCSACHAAHASDNTFLMQTEGVIEACGSCHDWEGHTAHPLGDDVVDQRNMNLTVDCLSCHRSHGSPFKAFTYSDPSGDLCVQCHQQIFR
jgi:predicted CXXCH cytochrome family protein